MQRPSRLHELHQHHARACWRLGEHAALPPAESERRRAEQLGAAPPTPEPTPAAEARVGAEEEDAAALADAESEGGDNERGDQRAGEAAPSAGGDNLPTAGRSSKRNRSRRKP